MANRPVIREKIAAADLQVGQVLLTLPGSPAISRLRRTKKGGIEVYVGKSTPVHFPADRQLWVGR